MVNPIVVKKWLEKAQRDLDFASESLTNLKPPYFELICFHFQQAGEKYLKAFIVAKELEFKKSHNLVELLEICKQKDGNFEKLRNECQFLTGFYIEPRYPEMLTVSYNLQRTERAQKAAKKVGDFVKRLLKIPS